MAKFELTIIIDTENYDRREPYRELFSGCCPDNVGLRAPDECISCFKCWATALEQGVKHGCESIHVRRLD